MAKKRTRDGHRPPAQGRAGKPAPAREEVAPRTRRGAPRPPVGSAAEVRVPPLPQISIEELEPYEPPATEVEPAFDADDTFDGDRDVAPIGPTEMLDPAEIQSGSRTLDRPEMETEPRPARVAPSVEEEVERQISELEARLDTMIRKSAADVPRARPSSPVGPATHVSAPPDRGRVTEPERGFIDTARELLSTDYYLRQWGRLGLRDRSEEVDEFGLDPKYESRFLPFFDFLHKVYFRIASEGLENVPSEGRCLIVANHSGGPLPYDGIMLRTALRREHDAHRPMRWLAEDFIYYLPFVGAMMSRIGAVRACQENAERLLAKGNAVAVFPEGAKGIGKLYKERYRLQRFGRGGFIRLGLRTQTPIVPCAIVGAEEANPMLYRVEYMTKSLGMPYFPVTPTFPALGPLGLLPAPTKWRIVFGERMTFEGYGPEAADDEILVGRLAERVRGTIQGMLDRALGERKSIWFG